MAIINHIEQPAPCHDHGRHDPHDHSYDHPLGYYDEHRAECCDDQLPVFSGIGRGLQGDAYKVTIDDPDTTDETHLHGWIVDSRTGEMTSDWVSENINGGELSYQYNLNPFNDPQTFTITFIYRRPGRPEWSWTTPAIPYIWTVNNDGEWESPDSIVGSGVATLFIKKTTDADWKEMLIYPDGTNRDDYNAPDPEEAWTVNIKFGVGGDIEVPNIDDLAKILGISVQDIYDIIADTPIVINGYTVENIVEYVDAVQSHIHDDQGFGDDTLIGDNPDSVLPGSKYPNGVEYDGETYENPAANKPYTIKNYIDYMVWEAKLDLYDKLADSAGTINNLVNMLDDLVGKIYGASLVEDTSTPITTVPSAQKIKWPSTVTDHGGKIPVGNINLFSGDEANEKVIRTRAGVQNDDVKAK